MTLEPLRTEQFELRFSVWLEDHRWSHWFPEAGSVAFHRWLPDGERDAIRLPIEWKGELRVWFERYGYAEGSTIRFDRERKEVPEDLLARQGVVYSGPLFGRLFLEGVSPAEIEEVRRGSDQHDEHQRAGNIPSGAEYYVEFGKRIARLLGQPLTRLFDHIRHSYGQYWVSPFRSWDSRFQTLGGFFSSIGARWFDERLKEWRRFRPTISGQTFVAQRIPWDQFLRQQDWNELGEALRAGLDFSLAARLLSRANRFLDEDDIAIGLVEGVTALEVAIAGFVLRRLKRSGISEIVKFNDLPMESRLKIAVAILEPPLEEPDLAHALEGIR